MYLGIIVFSCFIGTVIGAMSVPIIYLFKRKAWPLHKQKYGFRRGTLLKPKADRTFLGSNREEHSANEYH